MTDMENFYVIWYTEYLGMGYLRNDSGWHVFPMFTSPSKAEEIWEEYVEPLSEDSIKMRFIELNGKYNFILYSLPMLKDKANFGFYRTLSSSETYNVFKKNFEGKVLFTFGILGDGSTPTIYCKSKLVTDVKFMKSSEVEKNSIEWLAEEVQRRLRAKYG